MVRAVSTLIRALQPARCVLNAAAPPRFLAATAHRAVTFGALVNRAVPQPRRRWSPVAAIIAMVFGVMMASTPAEAATLTVTSLENDGSGACTSTCTLRDALTVAAAQPGDDDIQFSVAGTIKLTSTLMIGSNVTIQGPGAAFLAVDGQNAVRVFRVSPGVTATLSGLTIQNGLIDDTNDRGGGGIKNEGGKLTLTNSVVVGNRSSFGGGGIGNDGGTLLLTNSTVRGNASFWGGGILSNGGTLTVTNSTVNANSGGAGGGIASLNLTTVVVTNITVSGNSATSRGGGIFHSAGPLVVTNSTITANQAPNPDGGGGVFQDSGGTTHLRNSIVAYNAPGGNCRGAMISLGNNLSNTVSCFDGTSQGDIVELSGIQRLGPLANNGGPTETHALLAGNLAIDGVTFQATQCPDSFGPGMDLTTDQRGVRRAQASPAPRCDIGAFELQGSTPIVGAIGANQSTVEDTPISIPFTVVDAETPASSLIVTGTSSNQAVVPDTNITFVNNGTDRTVTVKPAADQSGTIVITISVSDGANTSSTAFTLMVTAVDDAPVNAVPAAQTVRQNTSLTFSAGNRNPISVADVDADANPVQVALSAANGTVALNGTSGLSIIAGADRTNTLTVVGTVTDLNAALNGLTFSPPPSFSGATQLKIVTSDLGNSGAGGPQTDTDTFAVTVTPFHRAPSISSIPGQRTDASGSTPTVPFSIGSTEVPASSLVVTARSSDPTLVPTSAIHLSGNDAARAIRVTAVGPAATVTITVVVSDGTASAQTTFKVEVAAAAVAPATGPCAPRPAVQMTTTPAGGRLNVTLKAPPVDGQTNNRLIELRFGTFENGSVTINGQPVDRRAPYLVPIPANTQGVELVVTRTTPGQPMMIPLTVFDECGAWPTFIGSGAGGGF